ncbi:hypothetical protein L0152_04825 [bacterium]|nr:hypothetical protein [bacterium]
MIRKPRNCSECGTLLEKGTPAIYLSLKRVDGVMCHFKPSEKKPEESPATIQDHDELQSQPLIKKEPQAMGILRITPSFGAAVYDSRR